MPESRLRVVLAEDDEDVRAVLAFALRAEGHVVAEVADGPSLVAEVREAMHAGTPLDVIVSDVRLPGCSGLQALEVLRADHCRLPVLFVTAFRDTATYSEAARLGVGDLLYKPFDVSALHSRIRRLTAPR